MRLRFAVSIWRTLLTVLFLTVVVLHLTALMAWSAPDNPIWIRVGDQITEYTGSRLISQTWAFFAPEPISQNIDLYAQGRLQKGTTPWFDISRSLQDTMIANRLSGYAKVSLGISNASLNLTEAVNALPHSDPDYARLRRTDSYTYVLRTAASVIKHQYRAAQLTGIRVAIVLDTFPRFTERARDDSKDKKAVIYLPWTRFPRVDSSWL